MAIAYNPLSGDSKVQVEWWQLHAS